eukprot:7964283-Karenia_brevis.AAC.1
MEKLGFQMHDITEASAHATRLGRVIDGQAGIITNASWRIDHLCQGALYLAARPKVTGKELEHLIGHLLDFLAYDLGS